MMGFSIQQVAQTHVKCLESKKAVPSYRAVNVTAKKKYQDTSSRLIRKGGDVTKDTLFNMLL